MLDAWHYFRSRPDGGAPALHSGHVDPRRAAVRRAGDTRGRPLHATLHERLLPGEGGLGLAGLLGDLRATGTTAPLGVEVFSDVLAAMDPVEVGVRAGASVRALLGDEAPPAGRDRPPGM